MRLFFGLVLATTTAHAEEAKPTVTLGAYLETYYQLHFQNPENRITSLRGFDNRSRSFTLSNVAIDTKGELGPVTTHVVLQVGHDIQTATVAIQVPHELLIEAGMFLSPIGPEVIPIKDNWNWSRSDLFIGLPAYHTGARVSRPLGCGWTATAAVYNGWNSVVDNNNTPSIALSAAYANGDHLGQVLYLGGIERSPGAIEGQPWRNLLDAYVQYPVTKTFTVLAQFDAGFERTDLGTSAWVAGAVYGKRALSSKLYTALRLDAFYERVPQQDGVAAAALFWPTSWIGSGTLTLAYQPYSNVSTRLEYRHDEASETQDTVTLGVTAWF